MNGSEISSSFALLDSKGVVCNISKSVPKFCRVDSPLLLNSKELDQLIRRFTDAAKFCYFKIGDANNDLTYFADLRIVSRILENLLPITVTELNVGSLPPTTTEDIQADPPLKEYLIKLDPVVCYSVSKVLFRLEVIHFENVSLDAFQKSIRAAEYMSSIYNTKSINKSLVKTMKSKEIPSTSEQFQLHLYSTIRGAISSDLFNTREFQKQEVEDDHVRLQHKVKQSIKGIFNSEYIEIKFGERLKKEHDSSSRINVLEPNHLKFAKSAGGSTKLSSSENESIRNSRNIYWNIKYKNTLPFVVSCILPAFLLLVICSIFLIEDTRALKLFPNIVVEVSLLDNAGYYLWVIFVHTNYINIKRWAVNGLVQPTEWEKFGFDDVLANVTSTMSNPSFQSKLLDSENRVDMNILNTSYPQYYNIELTASTEFDILYWSEHADEYSIKRVHRFDAAKYLTVYLNELLGTDYVDLRPVESLEERRRLSQKEEVVMYNLQNPLTKYYLQRRFC